MPPEIAQTNKKILNESVNSSEHIITAIKLTQRSCKFTFTHHAEPKMLGNTLLRNKFKQNVGDNKIL